MGDDRDINQLDKLFHQVAGDPSGDVQLKLLLHGILTLQASMVERLEDVEEAIANLRKPIDNLTERIHAVEGRFSTAFVSDDPEGHRRFHEAYIERTAEIKKIRVAIAEKTLSAMLWSAVVFGGSMLWHYLIAVVKKGGV